MIGFQLMRRLAVAGLSVAALPSLLRGQQQSDRAAPRIAISRGAETHWSSQVTPRIRVTDDAYVLVVARNWNGEIKVLYPESPQESSRIAARTPVDVRTFFSGFYDPRSSQGVVIGLAARAPFNLESISSGSDWNAAAISSLMQAIIPQVASNALATHLGAKGEPIGVAFMSFGADYIPPPSLHHFSDGINP